MTDSAYGLWLLVILNSIVFIIFALSFFKPQTKTDWRAFSGYAAFIVALFTEMYGYPLTIFLLSGWLAQRFPGLDIFSHNSGHLWHTIFGLKGNPHFDVFHIASFAFIGAGFWLISASWSELYKAAKAHTLATSGAYAVVRHPQYDGFLIIMLGFLLQWPTLLTLLMFPILTFMYVRLARTEEKQMEREFGGAYLTYVEQVPAFIPRLHAAGQHPQPQARINS